MRLKLGEASRNQLTGDNARPMRSLNIVIEEAFPEA
jgi:hypothetical protein